MAGGLSHLNPSDGSSIGLDRLTYMKDSFWLRMSIGKKWQWYDREDGNDKSIDSQFPVGEVRKHQ
jgi:hypothetical protein